MELTRALTLCCAALLIVVFWTHGAHSAPAQIAAPFNLRCEYQQNPLAIDTAAPRLSWELADTRRGARQTAYRVLVASDRAHLDANRGTAWDTGRVNSDRSIQVEYGGKPLRAGRRYWWKVRVWDMHGGPSPWSEPARWEMGLLSPDDWQAQWIGLPYPEETQNPKTDAAPLGEWIYPYNMIDRFEYWNRQAGYHHFRKEFALEGGEIGRAVFGIQTDKPYAVWLNGEQVADRLGEVEGTRDRKVFDELEHLRPPIATLEIGDRLRAGKNVVAVKLFKPEQTPLAAMRCGLRVETAKGQISILSDRTWLAAAGEDPEHPANMGPVPYVDIPDNWHTASFENAPPDSKKSWRCADSSGYTHPLKNRRSIYLRRGFRLLTGIRRARLYVTALGSHRVWINGRRASNDVLAPGKGSFDHFYIIESAASRYDDPELKRRLLNYQVYDVTRQLRTGANAVGAVLGNGWYNSVGCALSYRKPLLLLELRVTYDDGRTEVVATDETWRAHPSPVLFDSIHFGEVHDARLQQEGWSEPGFRTEDWPTASAISPEYHYHYAHSDAPALVAENVAPIRVTAELEPAQVQKTGEDEYLFRFKQLASGFCRLRVRDARPGTRIKLHYGFHDWAINRRFGNQNEDTYVCRGGPEEVWAKKFGYGLIKYVRVRGYPGKPPPDALTFLVAHTDLPAAGTFECSNDTINAIWRAIRWTLRGNIHSVPVDCDREKICWAEFSLHTDTVPYFFDVSRFAPRLIQFCGGPGNGVWVGGWSDGIVGYPYHACLMYGDRRFAGEHYSHMAALMERRIRPEKAYFWGHGSFGDWHGLNRRPEHGGMFGAGHHYETVRWLSRLASWLEKEGDAARYRELLPKIREASTVRLFDEENVTYPGNNQRALAIPLASDFVPDEAREAIEHKFIHMVADCDEFLGNNRPISPVPYDKLKERCLESGGESLDYHPTVGLYGTPFFFPALERIGRHDVAYRVMSLTSYPSWGHMAREGGAMAETYSAGYSHTGRTNIGNWVFETLGGIRPDPDAPGFKNVIIKPQPAGDLSWASVTHNSMYGTIASDWRIEDGGEFTLRVDVPPNTTATVHLPHGGEPGVQITEGGIALEQVEGVITVNGSPHETVCNVAAGQYEFRVSGER